MATKYEARVEGKVVGKRTTAGRTYTSAIVLVRSQEFYRERAFNYVVTETDKSNFKYAVKAAASEGQVIEPGPGQKDCRWGAPANHYVSSWADNTQYIGAYTDEVVARSKAEIVGGFEGYVARRKEAEIAKFNKMSFAPFVVAWAGRPDLAQKEAAKYRNEPSIASVMIVPAEIAGGKK